MITGKKLISFIFIPLAMASVSCSARIDGVLQTGGKADLVLQASLENRTTALIRSLRNFVGDDTGAPTLDSQSINSSMAAAPGIRDVSLKNTGPSALEGSIALSNVGDFLASENAKSSLVTYAEGNGAGSSSIIIILDRDTIPVLVSKLSPDVEDYLSALMVPVVLGETSTAKEYLDLVASVYGRPLADEIAASRIRAFIEFPRPVTNVLGGKASGNRAEFDIPLLDIFVLEKPLRYEVNW